MVRADDSSIRREAERLGLPLADAILRGLRASYAEEGPVPTVLAICPNSEAVVRASVAAAREAEAPLFFAATLNQVDLDGGYTGWTQQEFMGLVRQTAEEFGSGGPIVVGLDHGGDRPQPLLIGAREVDVRLHLFEGMGRRRAALPKVDLHPLPPSRCAR